MIGKFWGLEVGYKEDIRGIIYFSAKDSSLVLKVDVRGFQHVFGVLYMLREEDIYLLV